MSVLQGGRRRQGGEDGGPGSQRRGRKATTHLESSGSGPYPCGGAGFLGGGHSGLLRRAPICTTWTRAWPRTACLHRQNRMPRASELHFTPTPDSIIAGMAAYCLPRTTDTAYYEQASCTAASLGSAGKGRRGGGGQCAKPILHYPAGDCDLHAALLAAASMLLLGGEDEGSSRVWGKSPGRRGRVAEHGSVAWAEIGRAHH